jgi:hypothetical protein
VYDPAFCASPTFSLAPTLNEAAPDESCGDVPALCTKLSTVIAVAPAVVVVRLVLTGRVIANLALLSPVTLKVGTATVEVIPPTLAAFSLLRVLLASVPTVAVYELAMDTSVPKLSEPVLVIANGEIMLAAAFTDCDVAVFCALDITDTPEKRIAIAKNLIAFMIVFFYIFYCFNFASALYKSQSVPLTFNFMAR